MIVSPRSFDPRVHFGSVSPKRQLRFRKAACVYSASMPRHGRHPPVLSVYALLEGLQARYGRRSLTTRYRGLASASEA
jgi:hypothetical protein